jgi:hypothetical protein
MLTFLGKFRDFSYTRCCGVHYRIFSVGYHRYQEKISTDGIEEAKVRNNPEKQTTELLKKVFGIK